MPKNTDAEKLANIQQLIDRCFAENAEKWEADKQLTLEAIERVISEED